MSGPDIDIDNRQHSHLYELRPMSRWWLVLVLALCLVMAWVNGFEKPSTWALLLFGGALGVSWLLVFPRLNLTKRD